MSSGIELLLFAPLLLPSLAGGVGAASVGVAGAGAVSGVVVTGSSIATTGAFASGSIAASSGIAGGTAMGVAGGAAAISGAVFVVGAAAAALLAAHHLHSTYQNALSDYDQRIEGERAGFHAQSRARHESSNAALLQIQKTRVQAEERAELLFLRNGVRKLLNRLGDEPGVDPLLPRAGAKLLAALDGPTPDLAALFATYESLGAEIADWAAQKRSTLASVQVPLASSDALVSTALKIALEQDLILLRDDLSLAPSDVLSDSVRQRLNLALGQIELLGQSQPQMAEQSFKLLRGRVGRELALGAARAAKKRAEQEHFSAQLRELSGRISARSQATLNALEDPGLLESPIARLQIGPLQAGALSQLERLSVLLAGELPADLAPLHDLVRAADALFETTGDKLRQIALQIYLESQIAEVFTQLGYRVSTVQGSNARELGLVASLGGGHGVEVHLDEKGGLTSELVAFSAAAMAVEAHTQDKVCALMDDVIEALQARGCGVREKKRRHHKEGDHALRVVETPRKKETHSPQTVAPIAQKIGD